MIRSSTTRQLTLLAAVLAAAACGRSGDASDSARADSVSATPSGAANSDSALMARGVQELYQGGDASAAVETFQAVLAQNPNHYGARFQLAKALDIAGRPAEARPVWTQVMDAATSSKDTVTASAARARLAQPDTVSQVGMMAVGLDLLRKKNNPAAAADQFRELLRKNPTHYGAHLQLAKALDLAGKPAEARPYWEKLLSMAQTINDTATIVTARTRLLKTP